jgi:hypothetical protein
MTVIIVFVIEKPHVVFTWGWVDHILVVYLATFLAAFLAAVLRGFLAGAFFGATSGSATAATGAAGASSTLTCDCGGCETGNGHGCASAPGVVGAGPNPNIFLMKSIMVIS